MKIKLLSILLFIVAFLFAINTHAQLTTHLEEGFEYLPDTTEDKDGVLPLGWNSILETGSQNWRFRYGGPVFCDTENPECTDTIGDPNRTPPHPQSGRRNAVFQVQEYFQKAKLITPSLNLTSATKPVLSFYMVSDDWFAANDYLNVYYRKSELGAWNLIQSYTVKRMNWEPVTIQLLDEWLSDDFYIAFEGYSNYGKGILLDSIVIKDSEASTRSLTSVNVKQASTSKVPRGYNNAPILRIDFNVTGNDGAVVLNSIKVNSSITDLATLKPAGVSLYHTSDTLFNTGKKIGGSLNFDGNGDANFTGLNDSLPSGRTSIWVTYSIDNNAAVDELLDAIIKADQITVDGATWPVSDQNPSGNRKIVATIFKEDFENAIGWNLISEFQIDTPKVFTMAGMYGYSNPSSAFSGVKVLGTDLNGITPTKGFYENNLAVDQYSAISPDFATKFYKNIQVTYQRYLNVQNADNARVYISDNNGSSWIEVPGMGSNPITTIADNKWRYQEFNASQIDRKDKARIRYTLGPTNYTTQMSGWNIDDIFITGDQVKYDMMPEAILSPISACGLTSSENITVQFVNSGLLPIKGNVPISFTLNGAFYKDTIAIVDSVMGGNTFNHTFKPKGNFSATGLYNLTVHSWLATDDDSRNDSISIEVRSLPVLTPSPEARTTFENNLIQYWFSSGVNNSWGENADSPSGTIIDDTPKPLSPDTKNYYLWMTRRNNGEEQSYVESSCYNLSLIEIPVISFDYFVNVEKIGESGAILTYSTDGGSSWNYLPAQAGPVGWKWYETAVSLLGGQQGFSSKTQTQWQNARQFLPASLAGESAVKFRIEFSCMADEYGEGFAFDNVRIMEAPHNLGIIQTSINTACESISPLPVDVTIRNYGYRDLNTGDSIRVGIKIDNNPLIIDTIVLTSPILKNNGSLVVPISKTIPVNLPGNYNIKVFTMDELEPTFYGSNNDTLTRAITVSPLPEPLMPDSIMSRTPHLITLSTGVTPEGDYDYEWSDDQGCNSCEITATYQNASAWKGYTAWALITNQATGCNITDTTKVVLLFNDLMLSKIISPEKSCDTMIVFPQVMFKHSGNDTIKGGVDSTYITYQFESEPLVKEVYHFTDDFTRGDSLIYTFKTKSINMNTFDYEYVFGSAVHFPGDTVLTNDSIGINFWVYHPPVVTMPYHDTTVYGLVHPMTIDPIANVIDYTWKDLQTQDSTIGEFNYFYDALTLGYHKITATDIHDCKASDSVFVKLLIYDVSPTLISPLSACLHETNELITIRVTNTGTDTISAGDVITIAYRIDSGAWRNTTQTLLTDLNPGQFINKSFVIPEDLSLPKAYTFNVVGTIIGKDIKVTNDTITTTIQTYGYPNVDLCKGFTCISGGVGQPRVLSYTGISLTLKAPSDIRYSYNWNWSGGSSQDSIIVADKKTVYNVFVTDTTTGCTKEDNLFLNLIIPDGKLNSISLADSACLEDLDELTLGFINNGNTNIGTTDTIWFGYKINNIDSAKAYIKPTTAMGPGATASYKFTGLRSKINATILNEFKLYVAIKQDVRPENNDSIVTVGIYPNPVEFDLGALHSPTGDTISRLTGTEIFLNPGTNDPGYSYLWADGITNPTRSVTTPGWYKLTISNQFNCSRSDSVFISYYVGLITISDDDLKLYPNPATVNLYIHFANKTAERLQVEILQLDGKKVFQKQIEAGSAIINEVVDVRAYAKGMYLIRISGNNTVKMGKIAIE